MVVPGSSSCQGYHRWVEVYRRAAAGKGIQVIYTWVELDQVMETL